MTGVMLADFSAFRKEADTSAASLKQLETGADQATVKLSKIGDAGANIQSAINDPATAATNALKGIADAMGPIGVGSAVAASGLLAVGAAAYTLASNAAETVAVFDDLHDKTGMSVPELSRLSNAANVVGADLGTLTNVVFKLEEGIGKNTTEFQKGLNQMGLSTAELKAAGPDQYLDLITKGLQSIPDASTRAAAGTAVLGKQYRDVAASLNDLATGMQLTADITPFTAQEAADAEAFQFQIANLKTHMGALATELGVALIPAVSATISGLERMGVAVVHVADLGGLVSGAWKGIKDSLGEADLAAETFNATAATANKLFSEQGATAESVAKQMLDLGFNVKTVAEHTGLSADAVSKLNGEMQATKDATEAYSAVMDRVNSALENSTTDISNVDDATKAWIVEMKAANISLKDMEVASGLTAAQINKITKEADDATRAFKAWKEATDRADGAMVGWQDTLGTISGEVVEAVKYQLSLGASLQDLAKEYGLTDKQAQAIKISLEDYSTALNANADVAVTAGKRQQEIIAATTKATNDGIVARLNKMKEEEKAQQDFLANNLKAAQAADAADIARQQSMQQTTKVTQEELDKRLTAAHATVAGLLADAKSSQYELDAAVTASGEAFYQANLRVNALSKGINEAGDAAASARPQFDQLSGTLQIDAANLDDLNAQLSSFYDKLASYGAVGMPGAGNSAGMPKGGNSAGMGRVAGAGLPSFGTGGSGDFGSGTPVMLHGKEAVVPLDNQGSDLLYGGEAGIARGTTVVNNIYITQPLGTPDAIARAVADAQLANAKAQGVRLPYA